MRATIWASCRTALLWGALLATGAAHAQPDAVKAAEPKAVDAKAAEAKAADDCEAAVADAVRRMRGADAHEVQFVKSKRRLVPSKDDETSLQGEGRYSGAGSGSRTMPFSYGCAVNTKTWVTSGVVFRDLGAPHDEPFQPDLTHVSVADCEGAAVAALKSKHPRAERIVLDSGTRQLKPAPNQHIALEGRGALERAPGMNASPFTYRCEVEPRSGRIVSVQTAL